LDYPASVRYLYSLGNEVKTIKLGLERMSTMCAALNHPERAGRFVHVAGTNGKGSTCAMIESALRYAGVRTGLYTSPHLVDPTERICIGGEPVRAAEFTRAFDELHECAGRMMARGAIDLHPTYFESLTLMAFLLFREKKVETVVLETGLGGRLDATNVVRPALSVITQIDIDHEQWLGETIDKIAFEKAGIIKPGVPVVMSKQRPGAEHPIAGVAAANGSRLIRAEDHRIADLKLHAYGHSFLLDGELRVECPLAGAHQVENARTAAVALTKLGLDAAAITGGIRTARWPGRLERAGDRPEILLDGAHNVAGAEALADHLKRFYGGRRIWMVFGVMRDKQVEAIGRILFPQASELILTAPAQARAMPPEELAALECARGARVRATVPAALAEARRAAPQDVVLITGSLYLVGEARPLL
jgi:dihydrofolate synthase/folylpolyglutamate synthase